MIAEHPLALSFILPGDVYLLADERFAQVYLTEETSATQQAAEPAIAYTPAIEFNYTGGYRRKFLILVHYPGHEAMEPAHFTALESTVKRKEMELNDVAIFNISKYPHIAIDAVLSFFKPVKMLVLGKNALPAGLVNPIINQLTEQGEFISLYTFGFDEMMGNKENTKAFWEQMKLL